MLKLHITKKCLKILMLKPLHLLHEMCIMMCVFHFTSSTISNKITRLHHNYNFFKNMLKEHCVGNYFILNGLVNVVYGTFVDYTKTIQPCYYG